MDRIAIFVDAGYLFAQGSAAIMGSRQPRRLVDLDIATTVAELKAAADRVSGLPLLRVYWYDGASAYRGRTEEHNRIAQVPDVKLRLGIVNSAGEQKGVDSLIVTDMIDLARNKAMADALLLSGDGDLLPGMVIAQSFGVRVHLLGIEPSRASQSPQLLDEADTTAEWGREVVTRILSFRPPETTPSLPPPVAATAPVAARPLPAIVADFVAALPPDDRTRIAALDGPSPVIPRDIDSRLLGTCGKLLGRDLDADEKRAMRRLAIQQARAGEPAL